MYFIEMHFKCRNVSSDILSLLSLIEMRKCICDSDFSQNVPKRFLRVFDIAFCYAEKLILCTLL